MSLQQRAFAWIYHRFLGNNGRNAHDDPLTRKVSGPLLAQAQGRVLEVGAADGASLALYPPDVNLTLLDRNVFLLRYTPTDAAQQRLTPCVQGIGERLPFGSSTFDTVVTRHVLCSVTDQPRVLAEVRRVLKPGGRFLFVEHVAAHDDTRTRRRQELFTPVWRRIGDGCHLARDTGTEIHNAGFARVQFDAFEVAEYPAIVRAHIAGTAWR